jgi:hypothetical protein
LSEDLYLAHFATIIPDPSTITIGRLNFECNERVSTPTLSYSSRGRVGEDVKKKRFRYIE